MFLAITLISILGVLTVNAALITFRLLGKLQADLIAGASEIFLNTKVSAGHLSGTSNIA